MKDGLAKAILEQDITKATVWVINLHKFIILYGLNFPRADHIYLIKVSVCCILLPPKTIYAVSIVFDHIIILSACLLGCFWPSHYQECWPANSGQVCKGNEHVIFTLLRCHGCVAKTSQTTWWLEGAVGTLKEEIPCTSVWAATGLEAVVWSLPGFDLFNLSKTLITISCSIGRIPVHQFGVYWKHPKASKPRSSPWSRWGQKKNIRDSVLIGIMQGVSRIFHRWEHKRDAGQVDSHALPSRQVLL